MERQARKEEKPRAPLFFLSYSQSQNAAARQREFALDLFRELSTHLAELAGLDTGVDAGFIDQSLNGGQRWTQALLTAAGTCQVFVPLVSPRLANSRWCGMEWHAFSRRITTTFGGEKVDHTTCMLPVIWVPTPTARLPRVIDEIQTFSPDRLDSADIEKYKTNGLYGLRAMGERERPTYDAVVWRLAQRIAAIYGEFRVEPLIPVNKDELRNVFRGRQ